MELKKGYPDKKKKAFFAQLNGLLKAGLSFSTSFSLIIEGATGKDKVLFRSVMDRIVSGGSLWEALSVESSFTRLDCGVLRIGEETGRLPETLAFLSDYYEKKESQRRALVSALSYPAITACVAMVVLVFMMMVVVPMFEQVYTRMGGSLPSLTRTLISMSRHVPAVLFVLACVMIVLFLVRYLYGKTETYQELRARILFGIPVLGGLLKKTELSRLSRIMYLLTSSNVPIIQSLELVGGILQFQPYRRAVAETTGAVTTGTMIYAAFASYPELFDRKFLMMLRVGEETASLERMFKSLADEMTEELNYQIRQLNNLLEPFLILAIGVIVAFVLIAMYLPMFSLGMAIQ